MAQAPIASMSSTGSVGGRGISYGGTTAAIPQVSGLYTSASSICGGVTTTETYAAMGAHGPRKSVEGGPGVPDGSCTECHWVWHPELGYYVCEVCGSTSLDGCDHMYEEGYCWCPLDFNGTIALFMTLLACAYALYKVRVRKSSEE